MPTNKEKGADYISPRHKRPLDYAAWAAIVAIILGSAFTLYGRFTKLEVRMDEADTDRASMLQSLERIEQSLSRLEAK
jgi:hypothetical protein